MTVVRCRRRAALALTALLFWLATPAVSAPPAAGERIDTLNIPGDPAFVAVARDALLVQSDYSPDFAANDGLIDDAIHVPSWSPEHIAALHARLQHDMTTLRGLPWRSWDVDRQIDVRWVFANLERMDREIDVERLYTHRPGAWLEPVANDYIAILTYAPGRSDALAGITQAIPAMVDEMSRICVPTAQDVVTARGLIDGIVGTLQSKPIAGREAAIASLKAYEAKLATGTFAPDYKVIGAENYAWRLKHAKLLPWSPSSLRALALATLPGLDEQIATLKPHVTPPGPLPPELEETARTLDQGKLLQLYDDIQIANLAAIERAGFVTVPAGVGPIRARVTPDAMIPLTGDGGSMDSPPPFLDSNVGYWNVEHLSPAAPLSVRESSVRNGVLYRETEMGPYAAHEGVPGHHLQLSIARLNPDPIRSAFGDDAQAEGWALYAEQEFWEQGGLGPSVNAHYETLRSWRFRVRRVVYDVNVETGTWTLQQAADWKSQAAPGKGKIDPDLLRSINWPAQLICYFAGKEQILALKADYKRLRGSAYSEREFNDQLLALGSVPYVFARAKMLGEPVPGF